MRSGAGHRIHLLEPTAGSAPKSRCAGQDISLIVRCEPTDELTLRMATLTVAPRTDSAPRLIRLNA